MTAAETAARRPRTLRRTVDRFLIESNGAIFVALIGMIVIFTLLSPNHAFLSGTNIRAMVLSGSSILVLAVGVTFVLISGHIDLSIGSILVLAGILGINAMLTMVGAGHPEVVAILAGGAVTLLVGVVVGLFNGLITTRLKIPSFIVTLGTLGIALGFAQLLTVGPISRQVPRVMTEVVGYGSVVGIPVPVLVAALITLLAWIVLSQTRIGLACYAVGSNREAARRAGVPVNRLVVTVFVLMGFCSGITAIIDMARFTTVSVASYGNTNLAAIAAVIIGGTSLFGGRGSISGTVVGVMIPVVLLSGLVILGVDPFWQNIVIGAMLIVAVAFDQYQRERIAQGLGASGEAPAAGEPLTAPGITQADSSGEPGRPVAT